MKSILNRLAKIWFAGADFLPSEAKGSWYTQTLRCPESGQLARITVDVFPGVVAGRRRTRLTVRDCSLRSIKEGCAQSCLNGRQRF